MLRSRRLKWILFTVENMRKDLTGGGGLKYVSYAVGGKDAKAFQHRGIQLIKALLACTPPPSPPPPPQRGAFLFVCFLQFALIRHISVSCANRQPHQTLLRTQLVPEPLPKTTNA